MAEEAQGIQNKRLLLVAGVLAGVVVVIYNLHIREVRRVGRGEDVKVFSIKHNMDEGQEITLKDVDPLEIKARHAEALGNVVRDKRALPARLRVSVEKNQYLQWNHIFMSEDNAPSKAIREGMTTFTLVVDPKQVPGKILSVGDRVNVMGKLALGGKPLRTYRIIEGLKVLAIAGDTFTDAGNPGSKRGLAREGLRAYQSITVEISPDISERLADVISHVHDSVWVEVIRRHAPLPATAGRLNPKYPELQKLGALPAGR